MAPERATVLVVDDEPFNVDLLEQELRAAGYRVLAAASGEEAFAIVSKERPDLVLLDVMMPGLDGYATCERLKQGEARDIPVIVLTALTDTFEKVRAFKLGAIDYITKPFEPEELLARVRTHIALRKEIEAHRRSRATIEGLVDEMRHDLVGDSPAVRRLRENIAKVAPTDAAVLIHGETGTGKELVARALHAASGRKERALVTVNCAALPRELVESELFGHEKGAFTGATQQRRGRFELADGGTLFLDEVGELPMEAQAKLLRVLQEGTFDRVGGSRTLRADVRVVAATNRNLEAEARTGRFRADLYYRLNVFPIAVPPLRERRDDLPRLVRHFVARAAPRLGRPEPRLAAGFLDQANGYDWPGNIRELENMVERSLIVSDGELHFPAAATAATPIASQLHTLEELERAHIAAVLERTHWVIEGDKGAARTLGLNPSTLRGRLRKLGIRKAS